MLYTVITIITSKTKKEILTVFISGERVGNKMKGNFMFYFCYSALFEYFKILYMH